MLDVDFLKHYDIDISNEEAREYIMLLCESYKEKKIENCLYCDHDFIPENIIMIYLYYVLKNKYELIVDDYKMAFIFNESLVEPGVTFEEEIGLGRIYDYIKTFNFSKDKFNIFVTSLRLHSILYSACPYSSFGGTLRTEGAILKDTLCDVLPPEEASKQFQEFLTKNIIDENMDVFEYIDECIKTTVDLIRIQPFPDGNKRTFRALLNIMLSNIKIPPIYIKLDERDTYRNELLKALVSYDYRGITRFYYYKICDAILELDINRTRLLNDGNCKTIH